MGKPEAGGALHVTLVYSPAPREVHEGKIELPAPATVAQALAASPLFIDYPELKSADCTTGIWGKRAKPGHVLRDGDRVEIYRGLRVDPKVARRERFRGQGIKRAGLFATKREGGKAGY